VTPEHTHHVHPVSRLRAEAHRLFTPKGLKNQSAACPQRTDTVTARVILCSLSRSCAYSSFFPGFKNSSNVCIKKKRTTNRSDCLKNWSAFAHVPTIKRSVPELHQHCAHSSFLHCAHSSFLRRLNVVPLGRKERQQPQEPSTAAQPFDSINLPEGIKNRSDLCLRKTTRPCVQTRRTCLRRTCLHHQQHQRSPLLCTIIDCWRTVPVIPSNQRHAWISIKDAAATSTDSSATTTHS